MRFILVFFAIFFSYGEVFCQISTDNHKTQALNQDNTQLQKSFEVPKQHKVSKGDTLWHLAEKYYSNPLLWGKIYNANLDVIENPDLIYPSDELIIPDVTEQIKPIKPSKKEVPMAVLQKAKEGGQEINAELTLEERTEDLTKSLPRVVNETSRTKTIGGFQKDENLLEISELMPLDQKEWYSTLDTSVVPLTWKEDGVITDIKDDNGFSEISYSGQVVELKLFGKVRVFVGDIFVAYKKGSRVYNKKGKAIGKEIQKTSLLEIIKIDKSTALAKIISANTAVCKGYIVKKK